MGRIKITNYIYIYTYEKYVYTSKYVQWAPGVNERQFGLQAQKSYFACQAPASSLHCRFLHFSP